MDIRGTITIDMCNKWFTLFIIAVLLCACGAYPAAASEAPVVSATARISPTRLQPGGDLTLIVKATIRPGYHVGAADKDALYPASLTLTASKGVTLGKPAWPKSVRKSFGFTSGKIPVYEGSITIQVKGRVAPNAKPGAVTIKGKLSTQACKGDQCFPPEDASVAARAVIVKKSTAAAGGAGPGASSSGPLSDDEAAAANLAGMHVAKRVVMLYLGGLLLALTPCVYPMIPVTFGFFSSQSDRRRSKVMTLAGAYVLGLALTYALLGTVAATTGSALGSALQSPAVTVGIAAVLVALALSMFGVYELRAPRFIQDRASGRSGVGGALLMGLIFGVVAAPCAGPFVLGLTMFAAKTGSALIGFLMFFILALGMGTPLFVLATFSAKLPVPGKWMLVAERLAGFVLLGAAAYFLMPIVPQPYSTYLIPAIVLAAGVYLGCMEKTVQSRGRLHAALGRGFCVAAVGAAVVMVWPSGHKPAMRWEPFRSESFAAAVKSGKPAMVDFSAAWCMACKELDERTWSDPTVIRAADGFARFRVDGTRRTAEVAAAEKQLGVSGKGYPIVMFFDSRGREISRARVAGFVKPDEMVRRIKMAD
jgi:thiol:disulfide interchange protein DsbD